MSMISVYAYMTTTTTAAITICSNGGNDTSSYLRQDETRIGRMHRISST